jgi:hypothetical protein
MQAPSSQLFLTTGVSTGAFSIAATTRARGRADGVSSVPLLAEEGVHGSSERAFFGGFCWIR